MLSGVHIYAGQGPPPGSMFSSLIHRFAFLAMLAVTAFAGGIASAAVTATEISEDRANADDIKSNIERRDRLEESFFGHPYPSWLQAYHRTRKEWLKRLRLDIAASYNVVGLGALGGPDAVSGFSGDFTLLGTWLIAGERWGVPLDLRFRLRDRHAIGGRAASEVTSATGGVFWNLIDGFTNAGFEVPDFQFVQHFPRRDLEIRYGQMTIDSQFDRHTLRSSKQAFFNRAFSSNPAVAFPRFGAGVTVLWKPDSGWDLTLGSCSVQGTQNGSQVDFDFGSGDFFQAIQIGRDFKINDNPSRLQAMVWHSDPVDQDDLDLPEGQGVSVTFEHSIQSSRTRIFARVAWSDGAASDADRLVAAGLGVDRRENDLFGIAAGLGRDSSGSKEWQAVVESFYRWQIGPHFQVSPEAQIIFGSGLRPDRSMRLVAGIRGQVAF